MMAVNYHPLSLRTAGFLNQARGLGGNGQISLNSGGERLVRPSGVVGGVGEAHRSSWCPQGHVEEMFMNGEASAGH